MTPYVIEVTHHGNYYAQRAVPMPDFTPEAVAAMMRECPYPYDRPERAAEFAHALSEHGRLEHGWTTWTVVGKPDDRAKVVCEWYARCTHAAVGVVEHPILGPVPTCARCAAKHDLDVSEVTFEVTFEGAS